MFVCPLGEGSGPEREDRGTQDPNLSQACPVVRIFPLKPSLQQGKLSPI